MANRLPVKLKNSAISYRALTTWQDAGQMTAGARFNGFYDNICTRKIPSLAAALPDRQISTLHQQG